LYTKPIADRDVVNAELYSTQGLQALYDMDNARTIMGNIVQTVIATTPTGSLRRGASAAANRFERKMAEKLAWREGNAAVIADEAGRVTLNSAEREAAEQAAQ
jgi:hypothetical protein